MVKWKLGNVIYNQFQRGKWLGNRSLEDKYLDLYILANNNFGLVKDYVNVLIIQNINIAEGELDDNNSKEFTEMKLTLTYIIPDQERSDEMLWPETPDNFFLSNHAIFLYIWTRNWIMM